MASVLKSALVYIYHVMHLGYADGCGMKGFRHMGIPPFGGMCQRFSARAFLVSMILPSGILNGK